MKFALLLLSYILQDAGYPAHLENGKCSACVRVGAKSKIYPGTCASTTMYCPPFYDENGKYVDPKCNVSSCDHSCTNGHRIQDFF